MPLGDRVKRVSGRSAHRRGVAAGEAVVAGLLHGNWLYWPSLALRRDALRRTRWRPGIDGISDFAHAVDLLLDGSSIVVDTTPAFRYRRHAGNDSSTRAASGIRWEQENRYYEEIAATLRAEGWFRAARAANLHLSSRLHAATVRASAVRARLGRGTMTTSREAGRTR